MNKSFWLIVIGVIVVLSHFIFDLSDAFLSGGLLSIGGVALYWLPNRYTQAWLRFVYWAFPSLIFGLLYIESGIYESSQEVWPGFMDPFYVAGIYILFVIGSALQILREWRRGHQSPHSSS